MATPRLIAKMVPTAFRLFVPARRLERRFGWVVLETSKAPRCDEHSERKEEAMGTILLIILILLLVGALPAWPYSSGWGYWPSGGLGLILLIVIVLALTGNI
jgi:Protein of unknown function (DUF3309)